MTDRGTGVYDPTQGVLREIRRERNKQDAKWGEQNCPLVTPLWSQSERAWHHDEEMAWKDINDRASTANGGPGMAWNGILLEELHEAFAENDPAKVRAEMVQVAAVAVAI